MQSSPFILAWSIFSVAGLSVSISGISDSIELVFKIENNLKWITALQMTLQNVFRKISLISMYYLHPPF